MNLGHQTHTPAGLACAIVCDTFGMTQALDLDDI